MYWRVFSSVFVFCYWGGGGGRVIKSYFWKRFSLNRTRANAHTITGTDPVVLHGNGCFDVEKKKKKAVKVRLKTLWCCVENKKTGNSKRKQFNNVRTIVAHEKRRIRPNPLSNQPSQILQLLTRKIKRMSRSRDTTAPSLCCSRGY